MEKGESEMGCLVSDFSEILEDIAPPELAEDWDRVGLQCGSPEMAVDTVLVALEVTGEVVEEARERGAGLIICHHPLIFEPLADLREDGPPGDLVCSVVRSGLAVYASHTNLDAAPLGVNTALAESLGLREHVPLVEGPTRPACKLVTFLPPEHLESVSRSLFAAGAGVIGEYTGCSFRSEGTGTFYAGPETSPAYGERGRMNEVREVRLEVQVEEKLLGTALGALLASHPYEEPAVDVYSIRIPSKGGMGRVGELERPLRLDGLAELCRERLQNPAVRFAGRPEREVKRVAVCGGRGAHLAKEALRAGAEVLVTGDVGHHQAVAALNMGLAVVDAGHYHTERTVVPFLVRLLKERASRKGLEVDVIASRVDACPWKIGGAS
ncbi:MAG: Nif3-like dinuclear metal center hexameric protein [Actinomycetota bacterium]|nr:Nif3-like dinuclear metal center hexameric protein [Actinomycetota bacterium]MDI7251833.1 Nif3-like dinuclear metal center hexameric protein [Actinomycetota bacterium]